MKEQETPSPKRLSLQGRLQMLLLVTGLVPFLVVSVIYQRQLSSAVASRAVMQMESVLALKKRLLVQHLKGVFADVGRLSLVVRHLGNSRDAGTPSFKELKLQDGGGMEAVLASWQADGGMGRGYDDIYLVAPDGQCLFSAKKGKDCQVNFFEGPWLDASMSRLLREVASLKQIRMSDYARQEPEATERIAFVAAPVLDQDRLLAMVAVRLANNGIQDCMDDQGGLGKSGEAVLVGENFLSLADSRLGLKKFESKIEVSVVKQAFGQDRQSHGFVPDYRGVETVVAAGRLGLKKELGVGFDWVLLAKIDAQEAFADLDRMRALGIAVGATIIIFVSIVSLIVARKLKVSA